MKILDGQLSLSLKNEALRRVEFAHATWIDMARAVARELCRRNGTVTADDVRQILYSWGDIPDHHNAWGAVFKGGEFVVTGEWHESAAPSRKGGVQRVWELV